MRNDTPTPQSSIKRMLMTLTAQRYPSSEYKAIFETVLIGSFILVAILTVLLFISYFALNNTHVIGRIFVCGAALLYLSVTYGAWIRGRYVIASQLLVLFYYCVAALVMFGWGVGITFTHLMFAITIVLAGTLLGSRAVIITAALSIATMFLAQIAVIAHAAPWFEDASKTSTSFGDVLGFSALLGVLALISALFGRRTQAMHAQDQQVKARLAKEKGSLELSVQKHSEQLRTMQLEEMEQLYKFAEMGQLSAVLMHDIAGHLTALNLDIADLKKDKQHGVAVKHVEESIDYMEQVIEQARHHLQIKDAEHNFDVLTCIQDSIKLPRFQHAKPYIKVVAPRERIILFGEPLRLSHTLVILVRNALEAYAESTAPRDKTVTITLSETNQNIVISVLDKGAGISEAVRKKLFSPLRSAKKDGLGIGLFIAKKITETHFNGTLKLDPHTPHTAFTVTIPKKRG
jgi:signal transduction histidine kinase